MSWLELLGTSLGLAMDAFAVSIAAGLTVPRVTGRHTFRMAFHFGLFQFLMPVLGWLAGHSVAEWIADYDHWVAFALLALVGARMVWEAFSEEEAARGDPTRGWMLVTLSVATSVDALAVGFSMALVWADSIWLPALVIGMVAGSLSTIGIVCGGRLGPRWGRRAKLLGGCVLVAIGVRILVSV